MDNVTNELEEIDKSLQHVVKAINDNANQLEDLNDTLKRLLNKFTDHITLMEVLVSRI